ncbi:unnamed protein product [Staurois parvus]|uniref:Uncharacterized protein n=1 Tax=Staurois parvus TaxID=386267 RepID=A0ABN9CU62_9NEOB|nr:unnamed protein product [Staurois parvus]
MLSLVCIAREVVFFFSWESAYTVNAGSGRPDTVNAGSGETRYSECRVRGDQIQ